MSNQTITIRTESDTVEKSALLLKRWIFCATGSLRMTLSSISNSKLGISREYKKPKRLWEQGKAFHSHEGIMAELSELIDEKIKAYEDNR